MESIIRAIKVWQKSFKQKYGHPPTKEDVTETAPPHIINLYSQLRDLSAPKHSNTSVALSTSTATWARRSAPVTTGKNRKDSQKDREDDQDRRFSKDLDYMRYRINAHKSRSHPPPPNKNSDLNFLLSTEMIVLPSFDDKAPSSENPFPGTLF